MATPSSYKIVIHTLSIASRERERERERENLESDFRFPGFESIFQIGMTIPGTDSLPGSQVSRIPTQILRLYINVLRKAMAQSRRISSFTVKGSRLGHDSLVDGMLKDGLWDVYNDYGMGVCAELCAEQHKVTREEQDDYAVQSFERGIAAQDSGAFAWEIVPVEVSGGRGKPSTIVDKDEGLGKFDAGKLRKLRPSFKETGGSVTAGNASSISDGAAALVLVSGETALKLGLHVIGKITGYADAAQAPELFTTAPALAIPKAISNAGLEASQVDYYEINEAFVVVSLSNMKLLGLNPEKNKCTWWSCIFGPSSRL